MSDKLYETKPALLLLLERLEANPNPPHQQKVLVSEYTNSIAMAAKECWPDLIAMFPDRKPRTDEGAT